MTLTPRLLKTAGLFIAGIAVVVLAASKLIPMPGSPSAQDDSVAAVQPVGTAAPAAEGDSFSAEHPLAIEPASDLSTQSPASIAEDIALRAARARADLAAGIPIFPRDIPKTPALPGVSGFEVQVCLLGVFAGRPCGRSAAQVLAEETDDPAWSRTMESRAISEAARLAPKETTQLYAVCRQTVCGVVIGHQATDLTAGNDEDGPGDGFVRIGGGEVRDLMGEPLAEALGLELFGSSFDRTFTALYYRRTDE